MNGRRFAALSVAVAVLLAALWLLRPGDRATRGPGRPPPAGEPAPVVVPPPAKAGPGVSDALDADLPALPGGMRANWAALVRGLLRTDDAARRRAEVMLLDPETAQDLRIALAIVLGTIGESDPTLLAALRRFGDDASFARAAILALGATREPEDDDEIFDLGDRPWGVHVAGLGITVRRAIDDAATRADLALHLQDATPETRLAAAQALRHSVASEDVRTAFLAAIDQEANDDVAVETGEALAGWAATAAPSPRQETVRRLLARASDPDLDGYRFRMEDDLSRVVLAAEERATLAAYASSSHPLSVRTFALTVLAGSCERSDAVADARATLETFADKDTDRAVRDHATRLLSRLPYDADTTAHLVRLARGDPEWSIRYTAVEALSAFGARALVLDALDAASEDPDERVAERARELRARLAR